MLKWLFGSRAGEAARGEDSVWMTGAARLKGLSREVGMLAEAGRSVLVVALTLAAFDELETALAPHQPVCCADIFARDALRSSLSRAGAVAVALSVALPADLKPAVCAAARRPGDRVAGPGVAGAPALD